jgi:hypothetical protein
MVCTHCRECRAPIELHQTAAAGSWQPLNPGEDDHGRVVIRDGLAVTLRRGEAPRLGEETRMPHPATCGKRCCGRCGHWHGPEQECTHCARERVIEAELGWLDELRDQGLVEDLRSGYEWQEAEARRIDEYLEAKDESWRDQPEWVLDVLWGSDGEGEMAATCHECDARVCNWCGHYLRTEDESKLVPGYHDDCVGEYAIGKS